MTAHTHRCCRALRQPAAGSGVLHEIQKGLLPCSKAGSRGSSSSLRHSMSMRAEAGQLGQPTARRLERDGGVRARVRYGRPAWLGRGSDCVQKGVCSVAGRRRSRSNCKGPCVHLFLKFWATRRDSAISSPGRAPSESTRISLMLLELPTQIACSTLAGRERRSRPSSCSCSDGDGFSASTHSHTEPLLSGP